LKELFVYGASGYGKVVTDTDIAREIMYKNIKFINDEENEYMSFDILFY